MEEKKIDEFQIVTFILGAERFGISIEEVSEIVRLEEITQVPNTQHFVDGVINLRGKILAVIDIQKKLRIGQFTNSNNARILVIRAGEENFGLLVDKCEDVTNINISQVKTPSKILEEKIGSEFIRGVVFRKEEIIILIDLEKLVGNQDFSIQTK